MWPRGGSRDELEGDTVLRGVERTAGSSFGAQLRRARERAALTQEELAERARLTPGAVSALERGERTRPYPQTQRALADALGLRGTAREALFASVPARAPTHARPAVVAPLPRRPVHQPAAEELLRELLEESRAVAEAAREAARRAEARHQRLEAALAGLLHASAVSA